MRTLRRSPRPALRRAGLTAVAAAVAATIGVAPLAAAAPAAPLAPRAAPAAPTRAPQQPFLFSYTFNHHLQIGGGNFTVGGRVYVAVKFNNGKVFWARNVYARTHPITPGGAVYVETTVASPCAPGTANGYARAYDWTTQQWTPRLPVPICVPID
ncbi:hypothetical protein OG802_30820 [Streptomyces sp. NBC_00704]|uniref:hypothetical protein n=1 Tax=Streptomyces sp. NBC_00704 TaxID=2975809 RepID=UPI002E324DDA|nr:hypothetical protein [Streptomyces sp. NBC_00704]